MSDFETGEVDYQPTLEASIMPRSGFLPLRTRMLVDSGADDTLFDADVGRAVGILDIEAGIERKIGGVTGRGVGYEHKIQFYLPELGAHFDIKALFVSHMGFNGILGQKAFFSAYRVKFDRSKLRFYTEKVPELKF